MDLHGLTDLYKYALACLPIGQSDVCKVNDLHLQGFTALHHAAKLGHAEAVALLLSHHANPNTASKVGMQDDSCCSSPTCWLVIKQLKLFWHAIVSAVSLT